MTAASLILTSAMALTAVFLLLKQARRRSPGGGLYWNEESPPLMDAGIAPEMVAKIFDPSDSEFVALETSPAFASKFREERTVIALCWLRGVRRQVSGLLRYHRTAARDKVDVVSTEELKLALNFVWFEFATGLLYCLIWATGPMRAARLLGWSLNSAERIRGFVGEITPIPTAANQANI